MSHSIVVLDPLSSERAERLRALLPEGFVLSHATERGEAHLREVIAQADYAISGQIAVTDAILGAGRRLRLLHKWGVGVDNFDLDAARARGIAVARTTGSNAVPVAEFALGLILASLRCIPYAHAELKGGVWRGGHLPQPTYMLSGKTVGIVGFGAIGTTLARLLKGFGCPILYAKRTPLTPEAEAALNARHVPLPELLGASDVVALTCPLTPETAGMIDAAALAAMKPTATLVNVARGGIVVEADLVAALTARTIQAAAFDVFETEPLPPDSPLLALDTLVVTPHLAAIAADNFEATVNQMFGNIARHARGEPIPEKDRVV